MAIPLFDAHCDTVSWCEKLGWSLRESEGHLDLKRLSAYEKAAQVFAIFHNLAKAPADGMFAEAKRQQAVFAREMARNGDLTAPCRSAAEIRQANAAGKVAALLSCEGSELLNCDPANIEWAKRVGVKSINLTWNHANLIAGSHCAQPDRGLNDLGRAFVHSAQEAGILIDVSHCSDPAFWDLMQITQKPVIASHSNARAVCAHTRNLTDDMFRAIVETGGVVGLNVYVPFVAEGESAGIDDLVRHVEHFLSLGGEKSLGLGADLDGCSSLAGGLRGVQDMTAIWDALAQRGYPDALLRDVFYYNFLRVFD